MSSDEDTGELAYGNVNGLCGLFECVIEFA